MHLNLSRSLESLQTEAENNRTRLYEKVKEERARRVEDGLIVRVTGYEPDVALRGRQTDREYLLGKMTATNLLVQQGVTGPVVNYIDANNVIHALTPHQFVELWSKAMAWIDSVYASSFALRSMDPIPEDFADDQWWPE